MSIRKLLLVTVGIVVLGCLLPAYANEDESSGDAAIYSMFTPVKQDTNRSQTFTIGGPEQKQVPPSPETTETADVVKIEATVPQAQVSPLPALSEDTTGKAPRSSATTQGGDSSSGCNAGLGTLASWMFLTAGAVLKKNRA